MTATIHRAAFDLARMGILRNVAGVVAGIMVSQATVFLVEAAGTSLYPPPAAVESADAAALAAWLATVPFPLKLVIVAGWLLGGVAGPWATLRIGGRRWTAWVTTALFLAGSIVNLANLPHPAWMIVCGFAFPLLGGWLAQRLCRAQRPDGPQRGRA